MPFRWVHYPIDEAVRDATERGLADAIIVTGTATGRATIQDDVRAAVTAAGDVPIYVGSGVTAENVMKMASLAHGVIVGSWLKIDGDVRNPVDVNRVRRLRDSTGQRPTACVYFEPWHIHTG